MRHWNGDQSVEDEPGSTPAPEDPAVSDDRTQRSSLSELEFDILVAVGKQGRPTVREVASTVHVTEEKARFLLDELAQKHRLVAWFGNMDHRIPAYYRLTHLGRGILVERGVFD